MTHHSIKNLPPKRLIDTRGRPALDQDRKPLTESMATYLLTLSTDPGFCEGLTFLQSVKLRAAFTRSIHTQAVAKPERLELEPEYYKRIRRVLDAPQLRIDWATLHCYAELNDEILAAEKPVEEPDAVAAE